MAKKPDAGGTNGTTQKSGRSEEPAAAVHLDVGSGRVAGRLTSDRVCLGDEDNLCAQTIFLEATEMSEAPFGFLPYDGILGLGMPGASLEKRCNFMGNLAEAGTLELDRFAIWLALPADGEDSEITFGALDEGRVASADIYWHRVARPEAGVWQLPVADVVVDGQDQRACGEEPCWAIFDSGTTVIGGPKSLIDALLLRLGVREDCSNYGELPALGFAIGARVFTLGPSDYVKSTARGCFHQFEVIEPPAPSRSPTMFLGEPFLRRFYTVYDRPTLKIGLALARHKVDVAHEGESVDKFIVPREAPDAEDE